MATNPSLFGHVIAGRYRLDQRRGTGAHGIVLDAIDEREDRTVAVKILRPQYAATSAAEARFRFEAQLAASLEHPNLNTVYDWGVEEIEGVRVPYLVLEHLAGGSLRDMIDRGRLLSPSQALMIGLDVCRGLDHLHRNGVIHRDIKPANLAFGEDRHLRILDVGISRMIAEQTWRDPVAAGIDAARYASPEQARGVTPENGLTSATDIYALALTLIESVTGQVPFSSDSTVATLSARIDKLMPVSADFGPLASVLSRAGSAEPGDRYSAAAMGRALVQAAEKMPRPQPMPIVGIGVGEEPVFGEFTAAAAAQTAVPPPTEPGAPATAAPLRPSLGATGAAPTAPLPRPPLPDAPQGPTSAPPAAAPPLAPTSAAPSPLSPAASLRPPVPDTDDSPVVEEPVAPTISRGSNPASLFANATVPTVPLPPSASSTSPASTALPPVGGLGLGLGTTTAVPGADGDGGAPPDTGYDPNEEYKPPRSRTKILLGVLVLLALVAGGIFVVTRLTKDEEFTVPALANQEQAVAQNEVAKYDWKVTVQTERTAEVAAGNVIRTEPAEGEKLKKGGAIIFVVSEGPPLSKLPDVTGQTFEEATATLEAASIGISKDQEVYDETVPAGTVISWSVPAQSGLTAGSEVMPGTVTVSVVVSKGPQPRSVPNLLGLDVNAATAALANVQLIIAQDPNPVPSNDYPNPGQIVAQSQPEGTAVPPGTTITVQLSSGPDLVPVPALGGLTYDQIVAALSGAGLTVGNITGDKVTQTITDAQYQGASLQPGQLLPRNAAVDLIFS